MWKKLNNGSCTSPNGFSASGIVAEIKESGEKDLGILKSDCPARVFGSFTRNVVKAAPVLLCQNLLEKGNLPQALVVNSGNANACTGKQGEKDAAEMQALLAQKMGVKAEEILVCSTGVIGHPLPMEKFRKGIPKACDALNIKGGGDFAQSILTTDTKAKTIAVEIETEDGSVRIGGTCKGSGMIHPNMATMLAFVSTDIQLPETFRPEFIQIVDETFNSITVDGDTSTNDTCLLMSNGLSGVSYSNLGLGDASKFRKALHFVLGELSKMIVRDGEGATKMVEVQTVNASSREDARKIATTVGSSNLVKTAIFGRDPNWGRIIAAAGRSGVSFDPNQVDILFGDIKVLEAGQPMNPDATLLQKVADQAEYTLTIDLNSGKSAWTIWTCDFSYDYVKINAEYTT